MLDPPTQTTLAESAPTEGDPRPFGDLPRVTSLQAAFEKLHARAEGLPSLVERWLPGLAIELDPVEILWRPSGLSRPGVIAQLAWPRRQARLGLGLETPLAHAIVDRLLGFTRLPAERQRQVTPVEWGILGFVIARSLDRLDELPGPLGPWDLAIDRVGPDPFDPRDLGPIVTCRWTVRLGPVEGSARLWVPEALIRALTIEPRIPATIRPGHVSLAATWRAEAGAVTLPRGVSRLKPGAVFPLDGSSLRGTVATPIGRISLACRESNGRSWFEAEASPGSSAARLFLKSPLQRESIPREPIAVDTTANTPPSAASTEIPVTLVVELGRVNLTVSRVADLKPGDLIELGRHSREPVELTSNGRLVARGELVQIDTELGVRVTNVLI